MTSFEFVEIVFALKRLSQWLVILALTLSLGLHWALLQGLAWTGTVVSFTQKFSLSTAIKMAVGGKNPCRICKFIAKGQQAEKKSGQEIKIFKLDLVVETTSSQTFVAPMVDCAIDRLFVVLQRTQSPPVPPPLA